MTVLAQSAFLQALGWALLHSLWQMGLCWLLYLVATQNGRKFNARQRYNIGFALTVTGTMGFFVSFAYLLVSGTTGGLFKAWHISGSINLLYTSLLSYTNIALPLFSVGYLLAVVVLMIRLYRQYHFTSKLCSTGLRKADPMLRLYMEDTIQVLGVRKKVKLAISELINTPLTIGFWRPIILLPVAAINHLSVEQTEAIILHELNHIRQNDYVFNILIAGLDVLLFFNPFSRWLTNALVREREHNCDDVVLQFKYSPCEYAQALYLLEKCRTVQPPLLAVSAVGSSQKILLQRIQRILYGKSLNESVNFRLLGFLVVLLAFALTEIVIPINRKIQTTGTEFLAQTIVTPLTLSEVNLSGVIFESKTTTAVFRAYEQEKPLFPNDTKALLIAEPSGSEDIPLEEFPVAFTQTYTTSSDTYGSQIATYSGIELDNSFSFSTGNSSAAEISQAQLSTPFVPSNSFQFNTYEDTLNPKISITSSADLKAREDLVKALAAIDQINWEKFEKDLGSFKGDLQKFQSQLRKALQEIDWKKMEQELQAKYKSAEMELKAKQAYLSHLYLSKEAKENESLKKLELDRQKMILLDRLKQNQLSEKCETENPQKKVRVKKIVVI